MGLFKKSKTKVKKSNTAKKTIVKKTAKPKSIAQKSTKLKTESKKVPWGRTLTTKDNFLGKQKTGSKKTRPVVVVDHNSRNELAVVPLSSRQGANRTKLKNYQQGKSYFKHFLEIKDNEGKPIKINNKFRENHKNMDIPYKTVIDIRDTIFNKSIQKQRNRKLYDEFKNKKNDWD